MRNIDLYIIEKLHLDKDIKVDDDTMQKMLRIISDYIIDWTYIGKEDNNRICDVNLISDKKISIFIEKESRKNFWNVLGRDLVKEIDKQMKIKVYFSTSIEDNKIFINIEDE